LSAETPTIEPLQIRAGDSVEWEKSLSDYPATEWTLTYYLRGPKPLDIPATADGQGFAVTISAATTAPLPAGDYWLFGRVTDGTDVVTVYEGTVKVLPNLNAETMGDGYDGRSHARKCRDALRAMMEGIAPHPEVAYTLFGERQVTLMSVADRKELLSYYESLVANEERQERISRGERTGIYIRRRNPR
jgi:hypothetical protein